MMISKDIIAVSHQPACYMFLISAFSFFTSSEFTVVESLSLFDTPELASPPSSNTLPLSRNLITFGLHFHIFKFLS